jgi:hypothetical protein
VDIGAVQRAPADQFVGEVVDDRRAANRGGAAFDVR